MPAAAVCSRVADLPSASESGLATTGGIEVLAGYAAAARRTVSTSSWSVGL